MEHIVKFTQVMPIATAKLLIHTVPHCVYPAGGPSLDHIGTYQDLDEVEVELLGKKLLINWLCV